MTDNIFSLTGKKVDPSDLNQQDVPEDEKPISMGEMSVAMVERIEKEMGKEDCEGFDQAFILFKKSGINGGFLWTSYNIRGHDLVGVLECSKILAYENYFTPGE